jgi:serine/threonine-protein kinase HipA
MTDLLKVVTFNVLIGNGDAHSKNYSILIGESGEVTLAPVYDAAPTLLL